MCLTTSPSYRCTSKGKCNSWPDAATAAAADDFATTTTINKEE